MSTSFSKKCFDPLKIHKKPVLTDLVKTTKYLLKKYDLAVEEHSSLFICMNCLRNLVTQKKYANQHVGMELSSKSEEKSDITNNTSTQHSAKRTFVNKWTQCKLNTSSSIGTQCYFNISKTPTVIEYRKTIHRKTVQIKYLKDKINVLKSKLNSCSIIELKKELHRRESLINNLQKRNQILKLNVKILSNPPIKVSKNEAFENCNEQSPE